MCPFRDILHVEEIPFPKYIVMNGNEGVFQQTVDSLICTTEGQTEVVICYLLSVYSHVSAWTHI